MINPQSYNQFLLDIGCSRPSPQSSCSVPRGDLRGHFLCFFGSGTTKFKGKIIRKGAANDSNNGIFIGCNGKYRVSHGNFFMGKSPVFFGCGQQIRFFFRNIEVIKLTI